MAIEWRESMRIDDGMIDADHKVLIDLVNQVRDAGTQIDPLALPHLLAKLMTYVTDHFARETAMFARINYPRAREHEAKHAGLVTYATEMAAKIDRVSSRDERLALLHDLDRTLSMWLINHILVDDMDFAPLVRGG